MPELLGVRLVGDVPGQAVGVIHPFKHRLRPGPVGGAVRPADREGRLEHALS